MIQRTKYIPSIISLAAGLIASIAAIINNYSSLETMIVVLIALIVFYIIGSIIRYIANKMLVIPEPEEETESEEEENSEENEGDAEETEETEATQDADEALIEE